MLLMKDGVVENPRIKGHIIKGLSQGRLGVVHGIVVHQTGGATAKSAFVGYQTRPSGTHFLIDKDGTIYQTANLLYYTNHVGLLKSRCLAKHTCLPIDMKLYAGKFNSKGWSANEKKKSWPDRYPMNSDAIGIELVGEANKAGEFVDATAAQNASLHWLVGEIAQTFHVSMTEIYRHPDVSWKQPSEARSARW